MSASPTACVCAALTPGGRPSGGVGETASPSGPWGAHRGDMVGDSSM